MSVPPQPHSFRLYLSQVSGFGGAGEPRQAVAQGCLATGEGPSLGLFSGASGAMAYGGASTLCRSSRGNQN